MAALKTPRPTINRSTIPAVIAFSIMKNRNTVQGVRDWARWKLLLCVMILGSVQAIGQELKAPDRLWECEVRDKETCSTWVFNGVEGVGQWNDGAAAMLVLQQFDPAWIIIRRSDSSGSSPGLTGVYVGKLSGDRIEGTVKWTWPGHWSQEVHGTWSATLHEPGTKAPAPSPGATASAPPAAPASPVAPKHAAEPSGERDRAPKITAPPDGGSRPSPQEPPEAAPARPDVMHLCVDHCGTFTWRDGRYVDDRGRSTITIETFTSDLVVLHGTDRPDPPVKPFKVLYVGQISPDGDSIVDGTARTSLDSGTTYFTATWGTALDSLPGNDQPLPAKITECEGGHCDGVWMFNGRHGVARWSRGSFGKLVVARYGPAGVVIQRVDTAGNTPGLTAVYTGQIHGNHIEGDVTWSWYGHWKKPPVGTWSATLGGGEGVPPAAREPQPALPSTPHAREVILPSMSEPTPAISSWKFDLSGDWSSYFNSPAFLDLIRVKQQGPDLAAEDLTSEGSPTGRPFFRGTYDPPAVAGRVELAEFDDLLNHTPSRWTSRLLVMGDPDHFRIGRHPPFQRITPPRLNDVPCDAGNSFHVQAKYATYRGELAHNAKDWKTALCWFRVGAEQGETYAQYVLASYLEQGIGGEKDLAQAFSWFKKSADEGSFRGAAGLEKMYRNGVGVPRDSTLADAWRLRGQALQAQENNDALLVLEGEKKDERDILAMGFLGAVVGSLWLSDSPEPCKIVALYSKGGYLSPEEEAALKKARREIEHEGIRCPGS
jgi:hypothetical protein